MNPLTLINYLTSQGKTALFIVIAVLSLGVLIYIFSAEISKGGKRAYEKFTESTFSDDSEYESSCVPEPGQPCTE